MTFTDYIQSVNNFKVDSLANNCAKIINVISWAQPY